MLGGKAGIGDCKAYTLQVDGMNPSRACPYKCDKNELLVIEKMTLNDDKLDLVKNIELLVYGNENPTSSCVQPGQTFSIILTLKRAQDLHIPRSVIDYPVSVTIEANQYEVLKIQ